MLHATVPRLLAQCYIPTAASPGVLSYSEHRFRRNWDKMICDANAISRVSAEQNSNMLTNAINIKMINEL